MNFNIVVIGSGLASLSFIDSYLEKNSKIDVISPDFSNVKDKNNFKNSHLFEDINLPPQMKNNVAKVRNYFDLNNFDVNKNTNITGSLEFGGLSNYWGLQIDPEFSADLNCLTKKNKRELKKYFFEIAKKLNFLGNFKLDKKIFKNSFDVDSFFSKLINKNKIINMNISKPVLAISRRNKGKKKNVEIDSINEKRDKINAKNFFNRFLKRKNIRFHNYVVKKINIKNKKIELVCQNGLVNKIFYAKKVVLGTGTLVTTKLILELLNIKKEIKIKEHPRLASCFFSKSAIKNNMSFMPSQMQIRNNKTSKSFIVDFKPGNKTFIDSALHVYKFMSPFKNILNHLKNNLIFSNFLLDSSFSNLFMKLKKNSTVEIYSKKNLTKSILKKFKKVHDGIFYLLNSQNLIYPFYKKFFPGNGSSYHYFGTLPINKKNKKLSVNNNCQLKSFKNIYIIDGSIFDFKTNKYPLGIIMANARRIGKKIK